MSFANVLCLFYLSKRILSTCLEFIPSVSPVFKSHLAEIFSACILKQVFITPGAPVKELSVQKPKSFSNFPHIPFELFKWVMNFHSYMLQLVSLDWMLILRTPPAVTSFTRL